MTLEKCFLTRNDCYSVYREAEMTGIVVHSTGANNTALKRYVQPLKSDPRYDELMELLGKNANGNHWNLSYAAGETGRQSCVHAFIGKTASGRIITVQTLPYEICCWGVGDGRLGSYNYPPRARIQFEICEDDLTDKAYFSAVFKEAAEYCAYLCRLYGWGVDKICSHYESYKAGYGGNHGDPDNWLKKFGKDMNWFRAEVQKLIDNKGDDPMTAAEKKEFDEIKAHVKKLEESIGAAKPEKVYHYYNELPDWARPVIEPMHINGVFVGNGPGDMNLPELMMRMLVVLYNAGVLKLTK